MLHPFSFLHKIICTAWHIIEDKFLPLAIPVAVGTWRPWLCLWPWLVENVFGIVVSSFREVSSMRLQLALSLMLFVGGSRSEVAI